MDCGESRELLQEELDGRLDAAAAARLAEHVAGCAACAEEKRGLASLRAAFRATPRPAAPAGFADGVMSSLPKGRVRSLPRVLGWIVAAAAVVVVAVSLAPESRKGAATEREVAASSPVAHRGRAAAKSDADAEEVAIPDAAKPVAGDDAAGGKAAPEPAAPPGNGPPPAARAERPSAFASKKTVAAEAPAVRYVVFHDAAAAERFATELAAGDGWKSKDKNVEPGFASGAPALGGRGAAGGADAEDARRREAAVDPTKEAAAATHRVVARTSVAAADVDAALAVEALRAGGSLVSSADTPKFAAVVEPPAPAAVPAPPAAQAATAPDTRTADDALKPEEKAKESLALSAPPAKSAPPRVVVVIVVLEPPPPTSPR